MTAQTLGNPLVDRPLLLNGPLARLGLPVDVLHEGAAGIVVGFELRPDPSIAARSTRVRTAEFESLHLDATFRPVGSDLAFTRLDAVTHPTDDNEPASIRVEARSKSELTTAFRAGGLRAKEAERFVRGLDPYAISGDIPERVVGARLRQFLPDDMLVVGNRHESELEQLRWSYLRYGVADPSTYRSARRTPISRPVLNLITRFLRDQFGSEAASYVPRRGTATVEDLAERLPEQYWHQVQNIAATGWYEAHRSEMKFDGYLQAQRLPEAAAGAIEYARRWFQDSVRHLGPLRAAPQPLYGLPEAASGTSVGRHGEYTAAVLSAHAHRRVWCPRPDDTGVDELPLGEAVNRWMTALGLLSSVASKEQGKLGFELLLRIEGVKRDLDLTTVGVGVSQALPVVTLGLLAEPGAMLLFEQPELHLHPDVQAALGDFFIALAASGRQLVVETHSEYLVTRLRRQAAVSTDHNVPDLVRLFFFERRGGESVIGRGHIESGGGIPDWPRGFLDTVARELGAIAAAHRSSR